MRIDFNVDGIPKGQPRPRAFARKMGNTFIARVYDAGTAEGWKGCVAQAAQPHKPPEPLAGPIRVVLQFSMPRPKAHYRSNGAVKPNAPMSHTGKPDCDNLAKAVLDALNNLRFWIDDSQINDLTVQKGYNGSPGVRVVVEQVA